MNEDFSHLYDAELSTFAGARVTDSRISDWQREAVQTLEKAIEVAKAITAGSGTYAPGETGWDATKPEFLMNALTDATYQDEQCKIFQSLPVVNVSQQTIQFLERTQLGTIGDAFIGETGPAGDFAHNLENDTDYLREAETVSIVHDVRRVSWLAQKTKGIVQPVPEQQMAAIRNIKGKLCLATYYSDRKTNKLGFNSLFSQIHQGVRDNPQGRQLAFVDADNKVINNAFLNHLFELGLNNMTQFDQAWMNPTDFANWQNTLQPMQRAPQDINGAVGQRVDRVLNPFGGKDLQLHADFMLRANKPLQIWGKGASGKPRDENTVDPGALTFASTPFASGAAGAAGTGYCFEYRTFNDMQSPLATVPAVPAASDGEANNQLTTGSYVYGISAVYNGRETQMWIQGKTAVSSSTSLGASTTTVIAVTTGQVVTITIDLACIAGIGSTIPRNLIRFRIYRAPSTATKISEFDLVDDCGVSITGNPTFYDNGWRKPGTRDMLLLNREWNGQKLVFYAQQVEVARRPLPNNLLSDLQGYLTVGTPILRRRTVTPSHMWIRNVGPNARL